MRTGIAALVAVLLAVGLAPAQSAEDVVKALVERQKSIKTAKCTLEAKVTRFKEMDPKSHKFVDSTVQPLTSTHEWLINFESGEFIWDQRGERVSVKSKTAEKSIEEYHSTKSYTNGIYKSALWPKGESGVGKDWGLQADFAEITGDLSQHPFERIWWPLFFTAGRVPNSAKPVLYPGNFQNCGPAMDDAELYRLRRFNPTTKETILVNGFGLNSTTKAEYILTCRSSGPFEFSSLSYKNTNGLEWLIAINYSKTTGLVTGWKYDGIERGVKVQTTEINVLHSELNASLPTGAFDITPAKGMVVGKVFNSDLDTGRLPEIKRYQIDELGIRSALPVGETPTDQFFLIYVKRVSVVLLAALLVIVFLIVFKRLAGKKCQPTPTRISEN